MKPAVWVGFAVIFSALAFGAKAFVTNLSPYVSFTEARQVTNGNVVQVMGKLDKASIRKDTKDLTFDIISKENEADRMTVTFQQAKPANFEQALEVTAIGSFQGGVFRAEKLLVKCPSKYQGTETKTYGAS
jgi:cytochrome c-type biogenesis protein CcmE